MSWTYMNIMQGLYPEQVEYFGILNTIFPFLCLKYSDEMTKGNLLSLMIDKCVRFTDIDPANTPEVRIAAMSLLTEVWLTYSSYIDQNQTYLNSIQHAYKKNIRDRVRSVRLVTATLMFKLLDKFAAEKNP